MLKSIKQSAPLAHLVEQPSWRTWDPACLVVLSATCPACRSYKYLLWFVMFIMRSDYCSAISVCGNRYEGLDETR